MALATRAAFFNVGTGVQTARLYPTSRLVASITGVSIPRNKAVVGENAFAHEAGIHQHGMLAHPLTYEIMTPASVGVPNNRMVLGKHSGRRALAHRLKELGFALDAADVDLVYHRFNELADRRKSIFDQDLISLLPEHHRPLAQAELTTGGQ